VPPPAILLVPASLQRTRRPPEFVAQLSRYRPRLRGYLNRFGTKDEVLDRKPAARRPHIRIEFDGALLSEMGGAGIRVHAIRACISRGR